MRLTSYANGAWIEGKGSAVTLRSAVTGKPIFEATSEGIDFKSMLESGRKTSRSLRQLTFHRRAMLLKELANYLSQRKEELYTLSAMTGATRNDAWLDVDGGIQTLFTFSSKARRELPNETFLLDGGTESLSKNGTFVGRHICVPLEGVAVHINAFNFPCWAMLEKFAPSFIAGMAAVVKPATTTCYVARRMAELILESKILPEGSLQLICGGAGDLFDHLTSQDVVTFTGSQSTGIRLKQHRAILQNSVRFNMEADSLNCCVLGPDAIPGTEEFDLFVREVSREMTTKAGQRCTAIRRAMVPESLIEPTIAALKKRLSGVLVGDPGREDVRMGPLVSQEQAAEVESRIALLAMGCELVLGTKSEMKLAGDGVSADAFLPPTLLWCYKPLENQDVHSIEAFGPVSTLMGYSSLDDAVELARLGNGSLVGSVFTNDEAIARTFVLGAASYHGRLLVVDRSCAKESTGHGSPLPHLVHGGPGRAGGGEEMGGVRAVMHYLQRSALQGSPSMLGTICKEYMKGGAVQEGPVHPFRKTFDELRVGDSILTHRRTVVESDISNFAGISGDFFYAQMDEVGARESVFGRRVAHGYFVLSAAAGLFVDPAPGPLLANYGLENLRFTKPVIPGDTLQVRLTCKSKRPKEGEDRGVVEWDVRVYNQDADEVASYVLLTLVRRSLPKSEMRNSNIEGNPKE
jgi:oxepin-CoA hydrolase / 3-oxo-5,6-dehydrosuberyl-CoA semialdehyde dehydrogenase